jgi:hypothetical protein
MALDTRRLAGICPCVSSERGCRSRRDRNQAFRDGQSRALGSDWAQVGCADTFHAIDNRPVWWSGAENGDWSPESSVDHDCASGLVSSLVISVVVNLSVSSGRHGVDLIGRGHT